MNDGYLKVESSGRADGLQNDGYLKVESSGCLKGEVELVGAKNAVLVTIALLLLTNNQADKKRDGACMKSLKTSLHTPLPLFL